MILKKLFVVLLLFIITVGNTLAYTSDEVITIHAIDPITRTSFLMVPEGKDFFIHEIHVSSENENVYIRNSNETEDLLHLIPRRENPDVNLIVKDDFQMIADPGTNVHIIVHGILVTEGQDVRNIIDHLEDGVNKPIFDEYTIQEIYLYEGILMLFIVIFTFFARLLGYKKKRKNKFL